MTLLRSTAPPTLRPTETPRRTPRRRRPRRAGTRRGPESGSPASGRPGRRGRSRRCARGGPASCAPRLAGSAHLRREALAALAAPAPDDRAAVARPHAGTEAVRAGALSLLWLPGSLHRESGLSSPRRPRRTAQYTDRAVPSRSRRRPDSSPTRILRLLARLRVPARPLRLAPRPMSRPRAAPSGTASRDDYQFRRTSRNLRETCLKTRAIWNGVREELRATLPPSAYEHWLEPLRPVAAQGSRLYVSGPERVRDWFERRYGAAASTRCASARRAFTEIAFIARRPRRRTPTGRRSRTARRDPGGLAAALDLRPLRDRLRQPLRPLRRARGRRVARRGLQPALPLRRARARQDPPAGLDRQLPAPPAPRPRRRSTRPPSASRPSSSPRCAATAADRALQGALPRASASC